jgi:ribosomal protein S18 acetylase RimI-like enzyme
MTRACREVPHGSDAYAATVRLRDTILRQPLGLMFSEAELAAEADSFHLGCWQGDRLLGCLVLRPETATRIRMRQVAVRSDSQGQGIGRELLRFCEAFAVARGYLEMSLHARESAVPFYHKLGYQREGDRFIEMSLPHFRMWRRLRHRRCPHESRSE